MTLLKLGRVVGVCCLAAGIQAGGLGAQLAWHLRVPATNGVRLISVTYGGGQFVAVGANGTVATSNDGANWQAQQSRTSAELDTVAFANGNFVAAGSPTNLFASSNGTNWLQQNWVEIASVLGGR